MKNTLMISLRLSFILLILCAIAYPALILLAGKAAPGGGEGQRIIVDGKTRGYKNVGQRFDADRYFQGRPSAVNYNAAGSGGSNKGPSNPDYLKQVSDRTDSFLVHNPGIKREQIPVELVTASGSGLDPHISPAAAEVQIPRIARERKLDEAVLRKLVEEHTQRSFGGLMGPKTVNVLELNIALDQLKTVK